MRTTRDSRQKMTITVFPFSNVFRSRSSCFLVFLFPYRFFCQVFLIPSSFDNGFCTIEFLNFLPLTESLDFKSWSYSKERKNEQIRFRFFCFHRCSQKKSSSMIRKAMRWFQQPINIFFILKIISNVIDEKIIDNW